MGNETTMLYGSCRSSVTYSVRIALNLLAMDYETVSISVQKKENLSSDYLKYNQQGLLSTLLIDGVVLTQSVATLEYWNKSHNNTRFLPNDSLQWQKAKALVDAIAMESHAAGDFIHYDVSCKQWMQKFIFEGLIAFENMLANPDNSDVTNSCEMGEQDSIVDMSFLLQVDNEQHWEMNVHTTPKYMDIYKRCQTHSTFTQAYP